MQLMTYRYKHSKKKLEEEAKLKLQQAKEKKEMLKKQKLQFSSTTKNITIGDPPKGVKCYLLFVLVLMYLLCSSFA